MNWMTSVTRRDPCGICGKDNWCRRSQDREVQDCYRQDGPGGAPRQDKGGVSYWRYQDHTGPRHHAPQLPRAPQPERASTADLDRVYRSLLRALPLEARHHQNLRARGLNDNDIQRLGYRTIPETGLLSTIKKLVADMGEHLIVQSPGFYVADGRYGQFWNLNSSGGILVPTRNLDGEIVGLKVRLDTPGGSGKFIYLSSAKYGGPGPIVTCHVPIFTQSRSVLRLTEGEVKADVATVLSGVLTLGLPGVSSWRLALPILEKLQPDLVLLAWDADWRGNAHVARSLGDCAWKLNKLGHNVRMETWDPHTAKGIDDLLALGRKPEIRNWMAALAAERRGTARCIKRSA